MEETIDPTSLSSINNPDSLYNPKNTSCSAIDDINDPTDHFNDPFNDPFSNDFGGGSGNPFDDHF